MGRHEMREVWRTAVPKQSYRFLIAIGAIVALAFLSMALVAALYPENGGAAAQGDATGAPADTDPDVTDGSSPPPPPNTDTLPTGDLAAVYSVPSNAVWSTGFQAQVVMRNNSGTPQGWELRLTYPQSVTAFVSAFIDGYSAPVENSLGQQYIITSTMPIAAGQTIIVKIEFDRVTTSDFTPRDCFVNGRACARQ
jgi:hypothetical protein